MADTVSVTQADREAAWPHRPYPYGYSDHEAWFAGRYDDCAIVQAFARHRLASTQPVPAIPREEVARLADLLAKASPLPWAYRPCEHDDWGYIRGPEQRGQYGPYRPIVARGHDSEVAFEDYDKHRAAKTDPYGPNAELIVAAVNALPSLLAALLQGKQP